MNHVFFGIIWVLAQILRLLYRIEVKGLENLPRNGVLLCPNHASDLDPVLIGICLPINYRLHFMAKEELFQNRLFGRILRALGAFPVNREGADIQAVKTAMKVIHEGENLLIFPEGTTIHDGVGARARRSFRYSRTGRRECSARRRSFSASRMCRRSRDGAGPPRSCRRSRTMCCARRMRSAVRRWEARRCEGHSC